MRGRIYTIVFYQCRLGARSRKPTRILSSLPMLASLGPSGWPHLSAQDGCYLGPLSAVCGCGRSHTGIIKRSSDDAFNTSQAAAYPPFMDTLISKAIWAFCSTIASSQLLKRARDLGEGQDGQKKEEEDAEDGAHRGEESTKGTGAQGCQKKARQGEEAIEGQDNGDKENLEEKTEIEMRQLMEEEKKVQNAKDENQEISRLVEEEIEKARRSAALQLGRPFKLAPLKVHYKGKVRNFCDGLGKCSPGIRPAGSRGVKKTGEGQSLSTMFWKEVEEVADKMDKKARLRFIANLALGKVEASPFAEEMQTIRGRLDRGVAKLGKDPSRKELGGDFGGRGSFLPGRAHQDRGSLGRSRRDSLDPPSL